MYANMNLSFTLNQQLNCYKDSYKEYWKQKYAIQIADINYRT